MSNRSLLEFNHDFTPRTGRSRELEEWAVGLLNYLRTADSRYLPAGITFKHRRHHSDPDPTADWPGAER